MKLKGLRIYVDFYRRWGKDYIVSASALSVVTGVIKRNINNYKILLDTPLKNIKCMLHLKMHIDYKVPEINY